MSGSAPKLRMWVVVLVLATFVIGFLVGIWTAFATAGTGNLPTDIEKNKDGDYVVHDHSNPDHHHGDDHHHHDDMHDHAHETLEVDSTNPPTLEVEVTPDTKSGYNVMLKTTWFAFAPERVNMPHVDGEGHAHIYVNDKKIARMYGPYFHLDNLEPGVHVIRVTLNSNDHKDLIVLGEPIEDSVVITV